MQAASPCGLGSSPELALYQLGNLGQVTCLPSYSNFLLIPALLTNLTGFVPSPNVYHVSTVWQELLRNSAVNKIDIAKRIHGGWFGASNLLTCDQHLEQRSARGTSSMSVCVSSSGQAWLTACGASTALLRLGPESSPEAPGCSAVP